MRDLLIRALDSDIQNATPNNYGTPTIKFENSVIVSFKDGYFDVCQGIHLVIRVSNEKKTFHTKYSNIGIVTMAESLMLEKGYTKD
jgi:hypothetical protein